jgi:hypothetical protein
MAAFFRSRTVGKTPAMAFVLDYVREFPGADYHRVKAAAQAAGVGAPAPVIYGNALRVLGKEKAREAPAAPKAPSPRPRRRSTRIADLSALVEQMQSVVEDRDRLGRRSTGSPPPFGSSEAGRPAPVAA